MHQGIIKHFTVYLILISISLFALKPLSAHPFPNTPKDTLLVGVAGSEPFVFEGNKNGIAIELWEEIAQEDDWNYKYINFDEVDDAIHSMQRNKIDVLIGPISITAQRLDDMRFSQPFYNSSISILSHQSSKNLWQVIKPLFSFKLLTAVGVFLIILAIVGTFFWLAERKASTDQFSKDPIKGIGTGMWLAIVTMSTTGYGDKAPVTLAGRIIAGAWMIISIIFATSMVAGIASTLTLTSLGFTPISTLEQLSTHNVATIAESPSAEFLLKNNIKPKEFNTLESAISTLEENKVDAVVYDRPQLLYYLKHHKDDDLYISKAEYYKQGYGFAFPLNSNLTFKANRALLDLAETQQLENIISHYIQEKD